MSFASAGAGILQAGAMIAQGNAARAAGEFNRRQYEAEADRAKTAGLQTSAQLREEFSNTLATLRTMRSARGLDPDSPTGVALEQKLQKNSDRNRTIQEFNYISQAEKNRLAGANEAAQGRAAQRLGYLRAGSSLLKTAGNLAY